MSHEFNWGACDARIRKLEALAEEVRAFARAKTFKEVLSASARLRAALALLDQDEAPLATTPPAPPLPERALESVMLADLLRRKRVYEALLKTGQEVADISDSAC
ncbi:hypothetical protein D3C86_952210 [compost metagenome]